MQEELSRRERKKIQAKNTIAEIAIELFFNKGFTDTTIAEIMDKADLAVGTFYNYFESKEEILKYCLSEKINAKQQTLTEIKQTNLSSTDKLTNLILTVGQTYEENRKLLVIYMHHYRSKNHSHRKPPHMDEFKDIVDAIVKEGQEKEEFRTDIPVEIIVEMFKGTLKTAMTSKADIPFMENVRYKLNLLLEGVIKKGD